MINDVTNQDDICDYGHVCDFEETLIRTYEDYRLLLSDFNTKQLRELRTFLLVPHVINQ